MNYSNALIEEYKTIGSQKILLSCKEVMENAVTVLSELDDDIQSANLMLKYAMVLSELAEYEESNYYSEKACELFRNFFGELDESMINIYLTVGDNYLKQGDRQYAEKYYSLVIQVYEANNMNAEDKNID